MLRRLARLGAALFVGYVGSAHALGLGEIDVASGLNQKFTATIPVFAATGNDIESLQVTLASPEDFDRAGIERSDYLSTLSFKVQAGTSGAKIIVSSSEIDREPFLSFLVQARWTGGKLLREYTVLLDPPSLGQSDLETSAAGAAPSPTVQTTPAPSGAVPVRKPEPVSRPAPVNKAAQVEEAPEAASGVPSYSAEGSTQYGPISPKETLWSIGAKLKSPSATMDQILLALYLANPAAFDHGRFDGLIKGSRLKVPSAAQVGSVSPEMAKTLVTELRQGKHLSAGAVRATPKSAPKPKPATQPKAKTPAAPVTPPAVVAPRVPETPKPVEPVAPSPKAETPPPPAAIPPPPSPPAETGTQQVPPATTTPAPVVETPPAATVPPPAAVPPPRSALPIQTAQPAQEESLFDELLYPILALVALLLIVFFGWRAVRKRKKEESEADKDPISPIESQMTTARNLSPSAFGTVARPAVPVPPPLPPELETSKIVQPRFDSETMQVTPFGSDSTIRMAEPLAGFGGAKKASASPVGNDVNFDLTSQFEASTLAVNLNANDPISEADFQLAYGLYDEAAGLLKQAIAKEPERNELRAKLCETYFAAGKPMEFQETAETLHSALAPSEWQKIAIMGRQLCPGSSMFSEESAPGAQMTDMDFSLDEAPAAATPPKPASADFSLGDFSDDARTVMAPKIPAAPVKNNSIDFDLDAELLKSKASTNLYETLSPADATTPEKKGKEIGSEKDLDLSHFDLAEPVEASPDLAGGTVEFNLDELDLSRPVETPEFTATTDEIGTKLDLARAYSDMGDNEAARSLLQEVMAGGTPAQRGEAEALAKRLGG